MYKTPILIAALLCLTAPLAAQDQPNRPYLLWTQEDIAMLRKAVKNDAWARQAVAELPQPGQRGASPMANLFRYVILQDDKAGQLEKKLLLSGKGNNLEHALRYDCLYDSLSGDEREKLEARFRSSIDRARKAMAGHYPLSRWNNLPNLSYFWIWDIHALAAAIGDKQLCRELFESKYMLKWYLDEYLSDSGFYNEEFSKMFVRTGGMLYWARAMDRLGMGEIGWDYVGKGGATWKGHVQSVIDLTFPRVDLGTDRYHYPRMTMGDAKGSRGLPGYGFQHHLVSGKLTDGSPRRRSFYGGVHLPQWIWLEIAHRKYPDAGFDYFLAQMREAGQDSYIPSLFYGLAPINPDDVEPPAAESHVFAERGLVMLRAEHGRDYWESQAPAVGMRLATPYAHHVQDCFALTGFYGYNRPLFVNRQHSTNYSGVDPGYSNSSRSHSIVRVDFAEPRTIGEVPTANSFGKIAKYAAGFAEGVFPDVKQSRSLVLTREYLLDVSALSSPRPRHYQWIIQAIGRACPDDPTAWTPSRDLRGSLFDLANERSLVTGGDWAVTVTQSSGGAHRKYSGLGDRWFDRRIGVKTTVLGESGTTAYVADAPVVQDSSGKWQGRDRFAYGEDEPAATTIVANRRAKSTVFVALHEPFQDFPKLHEAGLDLKMGGAADELMRKLAEKVPPGSARAEVADGVAAIVIEHDPEQKRVDYIFLDLKKRDKTVASPLAAATARFRQFAFVRKDGSDVTIEGELDALTLVNLPGKIRLHRKGKTETLELESGRLEIGKLDSRRVIVMADVSRSMEMPEEPGALISTQWRPGYSLNLPTGGTGKAKLRLRNISPITADGVIELAGSDGLRLQPERVRLEDFQPGTERDIEVTIQAGSSMVNRLHRVVCRSGQGNLDVQPTVLPVANGMAHVRDMAWPADYTETIFSPRYTAKIYYMQSTATSLLIDPNGYRRSNSAGDTLPQLVRQETDHRGRNRWRGRNFPKFPYFVPVVVSEGDGPAVIYDGGRHAHGTTGGLEQWFTEDWIVVRYREGKEGERIALDWNPSSRKNELADSIKGRRQQLAETLDPGVGIVIDKDGQAHQLDADQLRRNRFRVGRDVPRDGIVALFLRPAGYEYGKAMFYPPGSRLDDQRVLQPADKPMAFTFCAEEELPALAEKWRKAPHTGQATDAQRGRYSGAFMPHRIDSEDPQTQGQ